MAGASVISLAKLNEYFMPDEYKLIGKGENSYKSRHIVFFMYDADGQIMKGKVHASMKDKVYQVQVLLKDDGSIGETSCECPKGQGKCHHMAALLLHAHYNISITDKQCVWSKKSAPKTDGQGPSTVEELFPSSKAYAAVANFPSGIKERFLERLQATGHTVGFCWMLNPIRPSPTVPVIVRPRDILQSVQFEEADDKTKFLKDHLKVTQDEINKVILATAGQTKSWQWAVLRKDRLTASNFGAILSACRRNTFAPSFYKRLMNSYNLDRVKAIQWGRAHESDGAAAFTLQTGLEVEETGLWLHSSGVLGASPDRIVRNSEGKITAVVEIKCPFTWKNSTIDVMLAKEKKGLVKMATDGTYEVNPNHEYYHQIQGQMHLVGCDLAYFVLWVSRDCRVFALKKDISWARNLQIMEHFYFTNFINRVIDDLSDDED